MCTTVRRFGCAEGQSQMRIVEPKRERRVGRLLHGCGVFVGDAVQGPQPAGNSNKRHGLFALSIEADKSKRSVKGVSVLSSH